MAKKDRVTQEKRRRSRSKKEPPRRAKVAGIGNLFHLTRARASLLLWGLWEVETEEEKSAKPYNNNGARGSQKRKPGPEELGSTK